METFTIQLGLRGKIEIEEAIIKGDFSKFDKESLKKQLLESLVVSEAFMDIIHDRSGEYIFADLDITDEINKQIKKRTE